MENIWLHRISHCAEVSYPLLEKEYLSVGWSDFSTPEFIDDVYNEKNGWQNFEKHLEVWGNPRNRYSLWRFIREMKKEDWVVVPRSGTFSIFEIEEDKAFPISEIVKLVEIKDWFDNSIETGKDGNLYNTGIKDENGNDTRIDLGFFRKVKPIATKIARYDADTALNSRMKIRQTNANISDLKDSVEKALTASKRGKSLNIYSQIVEKTSQQILDTIQSELTPDKFESLVKWYFERIGATNVYIPSKNESGKEGDADVIATFEPIKTIIYTQVKFHSGETSSWAIEQITNYKSQKDGIDDGYSKIAWVISSSDHFSEEAQNKAKAAKIQLFNGIQFATMLLEAGISNLNGAI